MTLYTYLTTSEDPSIPIRWLDYAGAARDLSTGTYSVKLVNAAGKAVVTKTTGITGYSSLQGTSPNTYNALIQWSTGELAITVGDYDLVFAHTVSSREALFPGEIKVRIKAVPT